MADVIRPYYTVMAIPEGKGAEPLDLTERVTSFEFLDEEHKADKLTLKLDNWDLAIFDDPTFKKGTILEFVWGYPGRVAPARRAVIQRMKGARVLTVEAHGLAMLMHKNKKSRTFAGMTLTAIATQIQSEYGSAIGVQRAGQIDVPADVDFVREHRAQVGETDAQFLTRLARKHGLEFYVDSTGMHFKPRNLAQSPIKEYVWYNGEGDFLDFDIDNNLAGRPGAVTKKTFDPYGKKTVSGSADNDSTKRPGLAPVIEIVDARTGQLSLQARASEEHIEHTTEPAAGVKAHADAKFRLTQHETIKLNGTFVGDPDLVAKRVIKLGGLGKRISGLYYIKGAQHTIDNNGYIVKTATKTDGHGGYGQHNVGSKSALNKGDIKKPVEIEVVNARTGDTHVEFRKSGEEH